MADKIKMTKYTFKLIPNNKKDQLNFFKDELKEFKKTTKSLKKRDLQIPLEFIKNGLYYSRNIRRLEKELDKNEM